MTLPRGIAIDKRSPVPLHHQIRQGILAAIEAGALPPGEMLPPETAFCEALGVSRATVRQALASLVQDGYLTRQRGKGTVVTAPKIDARFLNRLESFSEEMRQKGLTPFTRVLALKTVPGGGTPGERLARDPSEPLLYLSRVRGADGEPIVYLETWLPYALFAPLLDHDLSQQSMYDLMERVCGHRVARASRRIEAVTARAAEASLLGIDRGAALCLVRTVACAEDGLPIEYSVARYRGDRNQFSVELYR